MMTPDVFSMPSVPELIFPSMGQTNSAQQQTRLTVAHEPRCLPYNSSSTPLRRFQPPSIDIQDWKGVPVSIPLELLSPIISYALCSDSPWCSRSKAVWRSLSGFSMASQSLREVAMRTWFHRVALLNDKDWVRYADPRATHLNSYVRCLYFSETYKPSQLATLNRFPNASSLVLTASDKKCNLPDLERLQIVSKYITFSVTELFLHNLPPSMQLLSYIAITFPLLSTLSLSDPELTDFIMEHLITQTFGTEQPSGYRLSRALQPLKNLSTFEFGIMVAQGGFSSHSERHSWISIKSNQPNKPTGSRFGDFELGVQITEMEDDEPEPIPERTRSCRLDQCGVCYSMLTEDVTDNERKVVSDLFSGLPSLRLVKWKSWMPDRKAQLSIWVPDSRSDDYQWQKAGEEDYTPPSQRFAMCSA